MRVRISGIFCDTGIHPKGRNLRKVSDQICTKIEAALDGQDRNVCEWSSIAGQRMVKSDCAWPCGKGQRMQRYRAPHWTGFNWLNCLSSKLCNSPSLCTDSCALSAQLHQQSSLSLYQLVHSRCLSNSATHANSAHQLKSVRSTEHMHYAVYTYMCITGPFPDEMFAQTFLHLR